MTRDITRDGAQLSRQQFLDALGAGHEKRGHQRRLRSEAG
jgi:hypothetical protein